MLRSVALGEPEHGSPCTFPHTRARVCVYMCRSLFTLDMVDESDWHTGTCMWWQSQAQR